MLHQQKILAAVVGFGDFGGFSNFSDSITEILIYFPFIKHPEFPPGLEVSDEVLEKTAGTDVNNM